AASGGRKTTERTGSGLVAGRREQVSAAANRPDHGRLGGIDLDLAANSHDPKVNGAIERLAVAGVRELQKPLARQHAFRIGCKHLEQAEFGSGEGVLVAFI